VVRLAMADQQPRCTGSADHFGQPERVWKKPAHTVSSHRLITTTASTIEASCLTNTGPRSAVCNEPPKIRPSNRAITGCLEKPGEADLLGKLKQHQLEQKDGSYLPNRSRPATGSRRQRLRAVDGE